MVDEDGRKVRMVFSDEEVMSRVADGHLDALRSISDRFGGVIAGVATRILADRADAEEVAADVIWQVWRQGPNFDPRSSSLKAYLIASARSHALDRLRARKSRCPEPPGDIEVRRAPAFDPATIGAAFKRNHVPSSALDEEEQRLLELVYFSELSLAEIGERFGIIPTSVKVRIRTAMIKLKSSLEAARR